MNFRVPVGSVPPAITTLTNTAQSMLYILHYLLAFISSLDPAESLPIIFSRASTIPVNTSWHCRILIFSGQSEPSCPPFFLWHKCWYHLDITRVGGLCLRSWSSSGLHGFGLNWRCLTWFFGFDILGAWSTFSNKGINKKIKTIPLLSPSFFVK